MADTWSYADWITQTDAATRLTRLRLHIAEVSQQTIGTKTRANEVTAVDGRYLAGLQAEERRLDDRANSQGFARNKALFRQD